MQHLPEGDLCPHAFDEASFKVPRHTDKVNAEECAYCCNTALHPGGIFVCAKTFVGVCPDHIEKLMQLDSANTTFVRIESTIQYPEKEPTITDTTQVGVAPPKTDKVRCYCGECGVHFSLAPDFDIAASSSAKAIVNAEAPAGDAQDAALAAWGMDGPCSCCNASLQQLPSDKFGNGKPGPTDSEKCNNCECNKNCWFCLTCGNVGCPRKEAGGQEHGIFHFMMTGHPLVVKLGTVTPKRADVHCYKCEREIGYYPELPKHLAHFGVQMESAVKTAKSLAEMELDRSLKHEYDSIQEAGETLVPCFGRGLTGLTNFGNTCYIASILQVLAATPTFVRPFYAPSSAESHIAKCKRTQPLNCFECQAERLFTGMLSGKYSIAPPSNTDSQETYRQQKVREDLNSIAPKFWKSVVAGNNADWKGKDQQDAEEYFGWVMNLIRGMSLSSSVNNNNTSGGDKHPGRLFEFLEETRRTCGACKAARYSYSPAQTLALFLPVDNPPPPLDPNEKLTDEQMEARRVHVDFKDMAAAYLKEQTYDGTCSHCKAKSTFTNSQRIATFPDFIAVKARREFYDKKLNQIRKMHAKVTMPEKLDLSAFVGKGFQAENETWLSEEVSSRPAPAAAAPTNTNNNTSGGGTVIDQEQLANLVAMDFDRDKCRWALFKCKNDPEVAISYIFDHPDEPTESDLRSMDHAPTTPPAPAPPADNDNNNNNEDSASSSDKPILIPKDKVGTDGAPNGYELYAMVSHMGHNVHSGHWIAHIKHPEHGWVIFNDEKVAISKKTPFTHGSMYFYRRV